MSKKPIPIDVLIAKAGSQSALARTLGVSQQRVWYWMKEKKPLPAEHVAAAVDLGFTPQQLRPDIFKAIEGAA